MQSNQTGEHGTERERERRLGFLNNDPLIDKKCIGLNLANQTEAT